MNGKQHAVMWLGITLIIVRLFTTNQWSTLWSTFTTNANPGGPGNTPSDNQKTAQGAIADKLLGIAELPLSIPGRIANAAGGAPAKDVVNIIDGSVIQDWVGSRLGKLLGG